VINETDDLSNVTLTTGDVDAVSLADGVTLTVDEGFFPGAIASITGDGVGAGTEALVINISTANATLDLDAAQTLTNLSSITINDTTGQEVVDLGDSVDTDATLAITTVNLSGGGDDDIVIDNDDHDAGDGTGLTVQNFTAGNVTGSDELNITPSDNGVQAGGVFLQSSAFTVTEGGASADAVHVIASSLATVNDFSATAANGDVEQAVATAIGLHDDTGGGAGTDTIVVALYGTGAENGNAAIYEVVITDGAGADITDVQTTDITVELLLTLDGIAADSLVQANF